MKRILGVLTFAVVIAGSALAQEPSDAVAEKELRDLNDRWAQAILQKDMNALGSILADDYVAITELGEVVDKDRVLRENGSPDLVFRSIRNDEVRVRLFGDAAVVTGRIAVQGQGKAGDFSGQLRYTDVYVRRNGRWVAVAEQVTNVAEP